MQIKLETTHLILRPISTADAQDFFELDSNPEVHRFLGNNTVKSIEDSKDMIVKILEQYQTKSVGRLAIIDKTTKAFLGWCGLKYEENLREEFNYYDLGYRLKPKYWGNGYATEAAIASLNYGFKDLKLKEICAAADVNNKASNIILQKIGMTVSEKFMHKGQLCNWYTIKSTNL